VPEYCSCGALLPEDARFCHRCGKPQREADVEAAPAINAAPIPQSQDVPRVRRPDPTIGFRNPVTVRISLFASLIGFILLAILGQISTILALFAMLGAGTLAVNLYRRRTGLPVTIRGGIHIGWITGVFAFITSMILVTVMAIALTDNTFASAFQSQLRARSDQEVAKQVVDAFRDPKGIADILATFFVACGVMPVVGGALGALIGRRS
jgi:hypothetical protein